MVVVGLEMRQELVTQTAVQACKAVATVATHLRILILMVTTLPQLVVQATEAAVEAAVLSN